MTSRVATAQSGAPRQGFGGEGIASGWEEDEDGGNVGGVRDGDIVTLAEAVADFDDALRDHRIRRRGLGSKAEEAKDLRGRGGKQDHGFAGSVRKSAGAAAGSPLHDAAASDWLNGEAMSWATIDTGIDNGPRRTSGEAGNGISQGCLQTSAVPAASAGQRGRVPQALPNLDDPGLSNESAHDQRINVSVDLGETDRDSPRSNPQQRLHGASAHDGKAGRAPEISSPPSSPLSRAEHDTPTVSGAAATTKDSESPRSYSPPVEKIGSFDGTPATEGVTLTNSPAPSAESSPKVPPTEPSPSLPLALGAAEEATNTDASALAREAAGGGGGASKTDEITAGVQESEGVDRAGASIGSEEVPRTSAAPQAPEAAESSSGERDEALGSVAGEALSTIIAPIPTTAPQVVPGAADSASPVASTAAEGAATAPQIALAMECPDPVSTVEQRTAGDWTEGSTRDGGEKHRLPAPLAVAEAEAELEEKVDRLRSRRLEAEREAREALDAERAQKFGRERASRAEGFAEEDRRALATEERRLADLRREVDLGRLQRGAEFQEKDDVLAAAVGATAKPAPALTTGATPMPVRGMRPQHFVPQGDLPESIKKSLNVPADRVLDEMAGLEARAKAAGGAVNLEAFEKVEQRQRARQVERLEILHGQTIEEKSATMLKMAVRLQMFARQKIARMRVARLAHARSVDKGQVSTWLIQV